MRIAREGRTWLQAGLILVAMLGGASGQRVENGQLIAFGGVRFDALQIVGRNQNGRITTWTSQDTVRSGGVTLLFLQGWWWTGRVQLRATLNGKVVTDCTTAPLKSGFFIVFVTALAGGKCAGDAANRSDTAQLFQKWMLRRASDLDQEALRRMVMTADDAWSCARAIAAASDPRRACQGAEAAVVQALR